MAEKQKKLYVDVPLLVQSYNEKHPDEKIDREGLASKVGATYQTITNYNGGLIPKSIVIINQLLQISGKKFEEVIKTK